LRRQRNGISGSETDLVPCDCHSARSFRGEPASSLPPQVGGQLISRFVRRTGGKVMNTTQKVAEAPTARRRAVCVLGDNRVVYLAVNNDTKGVYSLFEMTFQPGMGATAAYPYSQR